MTHLKKVSVFILILLASISFIEAQDKNGNLTILIKDQFDAAIPDAEVTLQKLEKNEKHIKTNRQGTVSFTRLEAGEYQIFVAAKGFIEYKSDTSNLKSGESKRLEITLEVAPVESKVDIKSEDSISTDDYALSTVLTEEQIAKMPDDPEEFMRALRRIAGESVMGEQLSVSVNGFEGERIPSKQQIQQIRIDRNSFSAATASGGSGIQIYSKSGTDSFRGSLNFGFADSRLNAADPFISQRAPLQVRSYTGDVSGPLWKNKASFSLYLQRGETDTSSIINAVILDTNLQPVEYKAFYRTPSRNTSFGGNTNFDLAKKHKIYISYNYSQNRASGQGVGYLSLPERAGASTNKSHSLNIGHTYLRSDKYVNMSRLILRYSRSNISSESNLPNINVAESFSGGGSFGNSSNTNFFGQFLNDSTQQVSKKLTVKYGFDVSFNRVDQNSRFNYNGTYNFNGRIAPLLDSANNPVLDGQGNIVTGQITSLESYRRTLLFGRLGYTATRVRELGGGADQFTISGGDPAISASQIEYNLYVQNDYSLRKDLGIGIGLRYSNQTNINSNFNFAPRIALNWVPKKGEKQSLLRALPRVGLGFTVNHRTFGLGNVINNRLTDTDGRFYYFISAANAADPVLAANTLGFFPNVPSVDLLTQLSIPQSRRLVANGFRTPYSTGANIAITKDFSKRLSVFFSVTRAGSYRNGISTNVNAPLAGTFDDLNIANAVYPYGSASGNVYEQRSVGRSRSTYYQVIPRLLPFKRHKKTTFFNVTYSFVKSSDDLTGGSGSPFDPYDFSREFAPSINDGVHNLGGLVSQQLPFGISISGNFGIRSGSRFNITTGRDSNRDGSFSERPSFASDPNKPGVVSTIYGLLDPNPAPGDKIIPRNLGRGPRSVEFSANLFKLFTFNKKGAKKQNGQARTLSLSLNISNLFNINNKGIPIGNMASPRFISIISNASAEYVDNAGGGRASASRPRSFYFNANFQF